MLHGNALSWRDIASSSPRSRDVADKHQREHMPDTGGVRNRRVFLSLAALANPSELNLLRRA